jgi:hypothetical protein
MTDNQEATPIPTGPLADSQGRDLPPDVPNKPSAQFDPSIIPQGKEVGMISPDGKGFTVPGESVAGALAKGWTIPPDEQHYWNLQKDIEGRNNFGPQEGDLTNTIADDLLDGLSLGVSPILENHLDDRSPQLKEIVAGRKEATEKEHPLLTGAAGLLGSAVSAIASGGESLIAQPTADIAKPVISNIVNKVIANKTAADIVTKIGTGIAKNAALSEVYSAPSQVANLTIGDPNQVAQSIGWSVGLGALLGAGTESLGAAGNVAKKILDKSNADKAQEASQIFMNSQGKMNSIKDVLESRPDLIKYLNSPAYSSYLDNTIRNMQGHKYNVDSKFEELQNPKIQSGARQDAQDKLNAAMPGKSFVNLDELKNAFSQDSQIANPQMQNIPQYQEIMNHLNDAGGGPTLHSKIDELRSNLSSLPESQLKDSVLKQLDMAQESALDKGMNTIGGKDFSDYLSHKNQIKMGQAWEQLKPDLKAPSIIDSIKPTEDDWSHAGASVLGGLFTAHPHLGFAGAAAYLGKNILKTIISKNAIPLSLNGLSKFADESPGLLGPVLVRRVTEAVDAHLNAIPSILSQGGEADRYYTKSPLKSFLGENSGLTNEQQWKKNATNIANSQANPEDVSQNLGVLLSVFASDPHLQSLIAQHNSNALSYLYSILPKNPNPPQPFSKNDWQPTLQQKADFLNQAAIVDDPMLVVHKIAAGSVTSKDMITLRTVYPDLADKIIGKVTDYAFSSAGEKASSRTKHGAVISGAVVSPSYDAVNMARSQSGFGAAPPPSNPNGSAPNPRHTNTSLKGGPSYQTEAGRLQYKGVN